MAKEWKDSVDSFLRLANKHNVRMLMVGGGAVNFHGYQRHSADVDFWIETKEDNFKKLLSVFNEMGYEIESFPETVKNQEQNISVKLSPVDLDIELLTRFSVGKTFDQAFRDSIVVSIEGESENFEVITWNVLSLEDLITSKAKSARPKDLLDIQQLKLINKV
jgi:hypothetical protein